MNVDSLLLDSNIVVHILQGNLALAKELEGKRLFISVISRIELFSWPGAGSSRDKWLLDFLSECQLLEMDRSIQDRTIELRKEFKLHLADAVIAATAMQMDLTLVTADKDFKKLGSAMRIVLVEP
ncbi:MAG: type II toxin-antitoxin system VapC family toxin [Flavobacteriales bacterium]